ncbi:MAG: hypothetical protein PVI28_14140 [Gammaproteobacteria bacterium]
MSRTQVVYHQTRACDLSIISHQNIDRPWVEGHRVQLAGMQHGAAICIRDRTRTLEFNEDGSFSPRNGPFIRRFLEGYYPMHVSMNIEVPSQYLRFVDTRPHHQDGFEDGFEVEETVDGVHADAWFEGKLFTKVRFEADFCDAAGRSSC